MLKKIGVVGASGMLGTAILDQLKGQYRVFATSRHKGYEHPGIEWRLFDLLDSVKLAQWLKDTRPQIVIHCAAIVNVDACEKDIETALAVHAESAQVITDTISTWNGRLIYISSDAVFDGTKKSLYQEEDIPHPLSVYGHTKLQGERITLSVPTGIVLRTTIFGWSLAPRPSFAEWVLRGLVEQTPLTMFTDVIFTPIYVSHFAEICIRLIEMSGLTGLFHLSGCSILSKYDFAIKLGTHFGLSTQNIIPVSVDTIKLGAKRAKNMTLANTKLSQALNDKLPSVDAGIEYFKCQYDNGWIARIKQKSFKTKYHFWE